MASNEGDIESRSANFNITNLAANNMNLKTANLIRLGEILHKDILI